MTSVCMLFKTQVLYLGITFCETMKDPIRQMRLLYANSNKLLRILNPCKTDIKLVLFDSVAHHYIAHFF